MLTRNLITVLRFSKLSQALLCKQNTAPGANTISYEMLKKLPDRSKQELLNLINISWERGPSRSGLENSDYHPNSETSQKQNGSHSQTTPSPSPPAYVKPWKP